MLWGSVNRVKLFCSGETPAFAPIFTHCAFAVAYLMPRISVGIPCRRSPDRDFVAPSYTTGCLTGPPAGIRIRCSPRTATGSEGDIAAKFLAAVLAQPRVKKLLSTD